MKESWQNLIDLIANPKAMFTRLKSKPKWGVAFGVFCFLVVVLAWIVFPFTQKFINPQYAGSLADIELFGSTKAASMVFVAAGGVILGVLCAVVFSVDMRIIPGIHMLVMSVENQYLLFFLSYIDILGIWNIFVLTVAVSTLAEVSKARACLTAVIIWLLRIGVDTLFQVGSSS